MCTGFYNTAAIHELLQNHRYRSEDYLRAMDKYWNTYNYYQMKNNKDFDFLYLKDNFNDYVGYMYIDFDKYILEDYVNELDDFILQNGYNPNNVTICGSSKGGFTSRIIGYKSSQIVNIVAGIPHIDLSKYSNGNRDNEAFKMLYKVLWSTDKAKRITNEVEEFSRCYVNTSKNEVIITGKTDLFIDQFLKFQNENANIYLYEKESQHSAIIVDNLETFLSIIYSITNHEEPNFGDFKKWDLKEIKRNLAEK